MQQRIFETEATVNQSVKAIKSVEPANYKKSKIIRWIAIGVVAIIIGFVFTKRRKKK